MDRSDEMADDDFDLENLDPAEPENWKRLREYAQRQEKAAREADVMRRENAFLRAGIDLSTRLGQAFAKTYDGKLDDIEAIRADAADFDPRIVAGASSTSSDQGQAPAAQVQAPSAPEQTGTSERNNLADGAVPSGAAPENVGKTSIDRAKQLLDEGKQWEVAAGEVVALRARAAAEGTFPSLGADGRRLQA